MVRACLLALPAGCTVVHVQGAQPEMKLHAGVLQLAPAAGAGSVSYSMHGFGVVPGIGGPTLGFRSEKGVMVFDPGDCRIVLIEPRAANIEALRQTLVAAGAPANGICTTTGGNDE